MPQEPDWSELQRKVIIAAAETAVAMLVFQLMFDQRIRIQLQAEIARLIQLWRDHKARLSFERHARFEALRIVEQIESGGAVDESRRIETRAA